jgi:hypothetical protein
VSQYSHSANIIASFADTVNELQALAKEHAFYQPAFDSLCCALSQDFNQLDETEQQTLRQNGKATFENYLKGKDCSKILGQTSENTISTEDDEPVAGAAYATH